ncbi:tautomerase family protein [Streptomyces sp. NPDC001984]
MSQDLAAWRHTEVDSVLGDLCGAQRIAPRHAAERGSPHLCRESATGASCMQPPDRAHATRQMPKDQTSKEAVMPFINMTVREGALTTEQRHEAMARLTDALMFWEKVPETPAARKIMKGWVYEVAADADYNGGSPDHEKPFYFIEVRILSGRLDVLEKQGVIRDFTEIIMRIENSERTPENLRRVWVTINELERDDWGIGGHTDWLRDYTSALEEIG